MSVTAPPQARSAAKTPAVNNPAGQRPPYWQQNREKQAAKSNNTPAGILAGFTNTPASQLGTAFNQAVVNSPAILNRQKDEAASQLPIVDESAGSAFSQSQAATARFRARNRMAGRRNVPHGNVGIQPPVFTAPNIPQQAPIVSSNINFRSRGNAAEVDAGRAQQALASVDLDVSAIPTTVEAPTLDLEGEADPTLLTTELRAQGQEVNAAKNEAAGEIANDYGENSVIRRPGNRKLRAGHQLSVKATKVRPVAPQKIPPADALITLNPQFAPVIQEKIGAESARYDAEQAQFDTRTANERQNANAEIDAASRRSQQDQLNTQADVQGQVNQSRVDWYNELNTVENNFHTNATAEAGRQRSQIQTEQIQANRAAQSHIAAGNREAEAKRDEAQERANREKENSDRESQGFFGWLGDKVASFINALKEVLNTIFNALRDAIKWIFDKVKRLALAVLELARQVIVGIIKVFGEVLKVLVDVVFAAFPGIRDRIKGAIDRAVNWAVANVNEVFEFFRNVVSALIDTLAYLIDSLLELIQTLYNGLLELIRMIVTGEIGQILEFIANLVEGARNADGLFLSSLAEESLGANPNAPLQDVEVPEGQEQAWSAAMGRTPAGNTGEQPVNLSPAEQDLLSKPVLSNQDVTTEPNPPVVLEPGLIQTLPPMSDGGTFELGGAGANAVTTQQIQQSVAQEAGYELTASSGEPATAAAPSQASNPDWVNMSDDQKLSHHLTAMLGSASEAGQAQPSPEREHAPPSTDNSPEALITKTGRLSMAQRLGFMGRQMLTGLQVLWQKYKVWIIAGLITGLLAAGLIALFTGGAGLAAVVAFLGEWFVVIFGAYAIARSMEQFWKYVNKAWAGDPLAAGKGLAMALAILVSEFLLDKILAGMGKIFMRGVNATKKALKGTRLGRGHRPGSGLCQTSPTRWKQSFKKRPYLYPKLQICDPDGKNYWPGNS
jgi:hypothetical protein